MMLAGLELTLKKGKKAELPIIFAEHRGTA
jgi:hypothetical protein